MAEPNPPGQKGEIMPFARMKAAIGRLFAPAPFQLTMTYEDFRAALRETPRTWRRTPQGYIRNDMRDCPLTKLCRQRTGRIYSLEDWDDAARHMRLPYEIAERILRAADDHPCCDLNIRHDLLLNTGIITLDPGLTPGPTLTAAPDPLDEELTRLVAGAQVLPDDQPHSHPRRPIPDPDLIEV